MSESPTPDTRSAVDKAMALLNAFGEDAYTGVGVSELARRANLSKSTAFRHLADLQANGAVERAGNSYRLGKMIQDLGSTHDSQAQQRLRDILTPFLADLYVLTKQTVHLAVLHGTDVVYLNKLYGHLPVRSPSRIGGRAPAYCTAVGKVLLAHDEQTLELVKSRPLHQWTPATITDPEVLDVEMGRIRRTNVAYDREEILLGLSCIAAPVMGADRRPVAALSISGPSKIFHPESQIEVLLRLCHQASQSLEGLEL